MVMAIFIITVAASVFVCLALLGWVLHRKNPARRHVPIPEFIHKYSSKTDTRTSIKQGHTLVSTKTTPISVNYHFTRQCNYKCGFCFHTSKTSFVLPLEKAKCGLKLLKDSGNSLSLSLSLKNTM